MKEYETPELELEEIETEDIMSSSGTLGQKNKGTSTGWKGLW